MRLPSLYKILILAVLLLGPISAGFFFTRIARTAAPPLSSVALGPTGLELLQVSHNVGSVVQGDSSSIDVAVKNVTQEALTIIDALPDCSCTTATVSNRRIEPGGVERISVTYSAAPAAHGPFRQKIHLSTSLSGGIVGTFEVVGTVINRKALYVFPSIVDLGNCEASSTQAAELYVRAPVGMIEQLPPTITVTQGTTLQVDVKDDIAGLSTDAWKVARIPVSISIGNAPGNYTTQISFRSGNGAIQFGLFEIRSAVTGRTFLAAPKAGRILLNKPAGAGEEVFELDYIGPEDISAQDIVASADGPIKLTVTKVARNRFRLAAAVQQQDGSQPIRSFTIVVKYGSSTQIAVPITLIPYR